MPDVNIQSATVIDFFSRMNGEKVDYALLRNYELYPMFGHDIDLIVSWRDLPQCMAAAKSCAADHGWDAVTECDHWARSSSREHRFQKLRFYSLNPLKYLQIDIFHSLPVLGLTLVDEDVLIKERIWDNRGFYRINEYVENLFKLLQIAKLAGYRGSQEKVERYRQRVLSFLETASDFPVMASHIGFPRISTALVFLRSGDILSFRKEIYRQKCALFMRRVLSRPFRSSKMFFDRFVDYMGFCWLRPCGFVIRAFAGDGARRECLERIMGQLSKANVVSAFTSSRSFKERLRVKAAAGVVLEWTSRESAQVVMDGEADAQRAMTALLTLLVERHPIVLDRREIAS